MKKEKTQNTKKEKVIITRVFNACNEHPFAKLGYIYKSYSSAKDYAYDRCVIKMRDNKDNQTPFIYSIISGNTFSFSFGGFCYIKGEIQCFYATSNNWGFIKVYDKGEQNKIKILL